MWTETLALVERVERNYAKDHVLSYVSPSARGRKPFLMLMGKEF
jgi:hypothetical protein